MQNCMPLPVQQDVQRSSASCNKEDVKGKARLSCGSIIMQSNMIKKKSYKERWKLHNSVSRNGYGNTMIDRYGGCFEEYIMWLMCERAYHLMGFGCTGEVCTISRGEIGQCTVPNRLAKYKDIGGSARNTILALVRRTHTLIIGNSLSIKKLMNNHASQGECMGVWLSLRISTHTT